jgi:hypothetical protein
MEGPILRIIPEARLGCEQPLAWRNLYRNEFVQKVVNPGVHKEKLSTYVYSSLLWPYYRLAVVEVQ